MSERRAPSPPATSSGRVPTASSALGFLVTTIVLASSLAAGQSGDSRDFEGHLRIDLKNPEALIQGGPLLGEIVFENRNETKAVAQDFPCEIRGGLYAWRDFDEREPAATVQPAPARTIVARCIPRSTPIAPNSHEIVGRLNDTLLYDNGTLLAPGSYRLELDWQGWRGFAPIHVQPRAADLVIVGLVVPPEVDAGARYVVTVKVQNRGEGFADPFDVALLGWSPREPAISAPLASRSRTEPLPPGDSHEFRFDLVAPTEWGRYDVAIDVDPGNEVRESDEMNNKRESTLAVRGDPDLAFTTPMFRPMPATDSSRLTVFVHNRGDRTVPIVLLRANGVGESGFSKDLRVGPLEPSTRDGFFTREGPAVPAEFEIPPEFNGTTIVFELDPLDEVAESDETNNAYRYENYTRPRAIILQPREPPVPEPMPDPFRAKPPARLALAVSDLTPEPGKNVNAYLIAYGPFTVTPGLKARFNVSGLLIDGQSTIFPMTEIARGESVAWRAEFEAPAESFVLAGELWDGGPFVVASTILKLPAATVRGPSFVIEGAYLDARGRAIANATITPDSEWESPVVSSVDSRHGAVTMLTPLPARLRAGETYPFSFAIEPSTDFVTPVMLGGPARVVPVWIEGSGGFSPVVDVEVARQLPPAFVPPPVIVVPHEDAGSPPPSQGGGQYLAGAAIVAGGSLLLVGAAVSANESWRYKLLYLLAPLYTRFAREDVLEHETRSKIHALISEKPGMHYSAIKRELGLANGALTHHLRMLQQHGVIVHKAAGARAFFYPRGPRLPDDPDPVSDFAGRILAAIRREPGLAQAELAKKLGASKQLVNYHVKRLERQDRIRASPDGRVRRLFVAAEAAPVPFTPVSGADGPHAQAAGSEFRSR